MISTYLWETGSIIILVMGILHMYGTLFSNGLYPRDNKLADDMRRSPPKLTDKLNMLDSWIGFNATHSAGAVFVGSVNFYLAWNYSDLLHNDIGLQLLTIFTIAFYVWVAKRFWFHVVLILLSLTLFCFLASFILTISK